MIKEEKTPLKTPRMIPPRDKLVIKFILDILEILSTSRKYIGYTKPYDQLL